MIGSWVSRKVKMIKNFEIFNTDIEGLKVIHPFIADDNRGWFVKDFSSELFSKHGLDYELKEVFYTISHKGVIRALHFQREIQQPKLVRCIFGRVFDVVVDLRKNSKTFKKWLSFELSSQNYQEILVPSGCAHGYLVLEKSIVAYKCAQKFYAEYDDGIIWNDPDIDISWPLELVENKIILSEKDKNLQNFKQFMEDYGGF